MALFNKNNFLSSDETVFRNINAFDYKFVPKVIPHREKQQFKIVACINPLFQKRDGRNLVISGLPGIGKTVLLKHIIRELEEESDDVIPIYINCWQKNTPYKIYLEICEQFDFKFTQNKRTEELLEVIKKLLNTKSAVFIFDEIDKAEDTSFLYSLIEEIFYKTIICITNFKNWISDLDDRVLSRLVPERMEFLPYNKEEIKDILNERQKIGFYNPISDDSLLQKIIEKTFDAKDIRTGLYLLKESGLNAEERSSNVIEAQDVDNALNKLVDFKIKDIDELDDDSKLILTLIKQNSPSKIGAIFKIYESKKGRLSYKSFQRRVSKLEENHFIMAKKQMGGSEGTTTILSYQTNMTLNDF